MAEEEFVIVTIKATKSYKIKKEDYSEMQLRKNNDLKVIRSLNFEVEVEDEQ